MATVLIMDQDQAIRLLYTEELVEEGYNVITCGDASKLMELIGRINPDLVIMEVLLGTYDGLGLLQDISFRYRDVPVILCTTYPEFREDLRSLAASGFVVKSSNLKELKATINEVLEKRPPPRFPQFYPDLNSTTT